MAKVRKWWALTGVAAVVILVAGWMLLVKPQHSQAATLSSQAASEQQSNQLLQTQIASLLSEQRDLPAQQEKLQQFTTKVPSQVSEPSLIQQLSAASAAAGVDLGTITPGSPSGVASSAGGSTTLGQSSASGLVELPLTLAVNGSYANIESFFQQLEQMPRAVLVTTWSIGAGGASTASSSSSTTGSSATAAGALSAQISAVVFYQGTAPGTSATSGSSTTPATSAPATSPPTS